MIWEGWLPAGRDQGEGHLRDGGRLSCGSPPEMNLAPGVLSFSEHGPRASGERTAGSRTSCAHFCLGVTPWAVSRTGLKSKGVLALSLSW